MEINTFFIHCLTFLTGFSGVKNAQAGFLDGFAACDFPLYKECHTSSSKVECALRGCCFNKGRCYRKEVPFYVDGCVALIIIIFGVFICFIVFIIIDSRKKDIWIHPKGHKKKEEEVSRSM
ncbi:hypothetical protein NDU88_004429 [Pleurodeles waltl]|uniref:Uncharacterized protein n=1 Tax=Pleurodeles waltl TaxID=8319 RepID=A0AAV7NJN1_PLEWA|nr:hypothetical protein NDU88_004429 [Pleurodeles waltl]